MLRAENVSVRFAAKPVLADASVSVRPGSVTALVGPNGAGKSTLLRLLSGELVPTTGDVYVGNRPLKEIGVRDQARVRSVVSQSPAVAFDYFVEEVLAMGWMPDPASHHATTSGYETASREVIACCELGPLLGRTYRTLSGGERQRVQFARALLQIWRPSDPESDDARFLLLDEPTSSLDLGHQRLVLSHARAVSGHNVGVLVVLHDLDLAARFADLVVLLVDGVVVGEGSPRDVFTADAVESNLQHRRFASSGTTASTVSSCSRNSTRRETWNHNRPNPVRSSR